MRNSISPRLINQSYASRILIITILLTVITVLSYTYPIVIGIPVAIIFPLGVLLMVKSQLFEKIKMGTLILSKILFVLTVLHSIPSAWFVIIIFWMTVMNILETVVTDTVHHNHYNAISGIALMISLISSFHITWTAQNLYVMNGPLTVFWILAFTLWNWNFVAHSFSERISGYHIAVLSVPIIISVFTLNPGIWLLARGFSLIIAGSLQVLCKGYLEANLTFKPLAKLINLLKTERMQVGLALTTVTLCILSAL